MFKKISSILVLPLLLIVLLSFDRSVLHTYRETTHWQEVDEQLVPLDVRAIFEQLKNSAVKDDSDRFHVENPRYKAEFNTSGFVFIPKERNTVKRALGFAYRLISIRSGKHIYFEAIDSPKVTMTAADNQVWFERPRSIVEKYIAQDTGIEQLFILESRLPLEGDLIISGAIDTALQTTANPLTTNSDIHFWDGNRNTLTYGAAKIYDSAGRSVAAQLRLDGTMLSIKIPADWLATASYPVIVDPLIHSDLPIIDDNYNQEQPAIAYNSIQNEYLLVWQDFRHQDTKPDILGHRLSSSGNLVGGLIEICREPGTQSQPAVAYDSTNNRYLVVWQDGRDYDETDYDIYGARLSHSGNVTNAAIYIAVKERAQESPDVAYCQDSDRYLVAWHDRDAPSYTDIYGRQIEAAGPYPLPEFPICTAGNYQRNPSVACNSQAGNCLAVWQDSRHLELPYNIYGQRISCSGDPILGDNFAISMASGASEGKEWPEIASNSTNDEYLVIWQDKRDVNNSWDIFGQRVSSSGNLLDNPDSPGDETDPTVNFAISTAGGAQERSAVTYNKATNEYLAVWQDRRNDKYDVYGQRVSNLGNLLDNPDTEEHEIFPTVNFTFTQRTDDEQKFPATDYNITEAEYLVVWQDGRNEGSTDEDIYGGRYACRPDLSDSSKKVSGGKGNFVSAGDVLTYTIFLDNKGEVSASVYLSDPIPDHTTYVTDSAEVTPPGGMLTPTASLIEWSGVVTSSASVTVSFKVTVDEEIAEEKVITNVAEISYNGSSLVRTATVTIGSEPPIFWGFSCSEWITDTQRPTCTIQVQDTAPGLDLGSAVYRYSTHGESIWSPWQDVLCTGTDGTTAPQVCTAVNLPFDQDSKTENKIQFKIKDIYGIEGTSPPYTVRIDITFPVLGDFEINETLTTTSVEGNLTCTLPSVLA